MWTPGSWRDKPAQHQPRYEDNAAVARVLDQLASLPPLVTPWEVDALRLELAEAAAGKRFLLQGGDCAERFADCRADIITGKLKILLQMSLVLVHGSSRPVVRVGRFAGQYAKPRSEDTETRDGLTVPSYRGDLVNGSEFTPEARRHDPDRLLRGYERSAVTLNYIRSLVQGGFADLHHPENWDLDFVRDSPLAGQYHAIVDRVLDSLRFMENVLGVHAGELKLVECYSSHEALHLLYEEALTRRHQDRWYNLSTHLPWVGMRTADPANAHIEYLRGIANPIAVKVGPAMTPERLRGLIEILDPEAVPGRLTFIHRFGQGRVAQCLPALIEAARASGRRPLWCCDPMHGNTVRTPDGIKTRDFDAILGELREAFETHRACGSRLGGVHFELTGENVTECTGGARGLTGADLRQDYRSEVDPRLNYEQALELAMLIAEIDTGA